MQYRAFGNTGLSVSALGFGTMRLPTVDDKAMGANLDETESIRLIRHAIDKGVNYIDTAYRYHDGNSELLVAKALADGYREKVYLAKRVPSGFWKRRRISTGFWMNNWKNVQQIILIFICFTQSMPIPLPKR